MIVCCIVVSKDKMIYSIHCLLCFIILHQCIFGKCYFIKPSTKNRQHNSIKAASIYRDTKDPTCNRDIYILSQGNYNCPKNMYNYSASKTKDIKECLNTYSRYKNMGYVVLQCIENDKWRIRSKCVNRS